MDALSKRQLRPTQLTSIAAQKTAKTGGAPARKEVGDANIVHKKCNTGSQAGQQGLKYEDLVVTGTGHRTLHWQTEDSFVM